LRCINKRSPSNEEEMRQQTVLPSSSSFTAIEKGMKRHCKRRSKEKLHQGMKYPLPQTHDAEYLRESDPIAKKGRQTPERL
jgi:hypothetical protein